jgi:cysteinyl-tRNA synthetase
VDRRRLVEALADAAGVPTVVRAVERSARRDGRARTGWPLVRWVSKLRPDPLGRLHVGSEDSRTSLPPASSAQQAAVTTALRRTRDVAAEGLPQAWRDDLRRTVEAREDRLADHLDRAVAGAGPGTARTPFWQTAVSGLQWLLVLTALVGALWLLALVGLAYLQLDDVVPLPRVEGFPLPTLLLGAGLVGGLLLALLAGPFVRASARRRGRRTERRLHAAVEGSPRSRCSPRSSWRSPRTPASARPWSAPPPEDSSTGLRPGSAPRRAGRVARWDSTGPGVPLRHPSDHAPARLHLGGRALSVVGRARVYVCGVTPYDVTHLGHAATFVWVDAADRLLRRLGVQVEVCRNVTDVDDVLFDAARRAGAHYDSFAAVQQFHFERDMDALGVRRPAHEPRAHTHVTQVVDLASALLEVGAAYVSAGSVYFRGADVAAAAGLDRDEALRRLAGGGGRTDDPAKDDPLDQAVWQASDPGDADGPPPPAWPSPWGPGRPGWHAECTAMALSTYGSSLDLHAGGEDLRFPHHAFEAAQAEAATGVRPYARSWLHVGTVQLGGEKMAKSTGNLVFAADLVARTSGAVVRTLLLDRRYGEPWDYAEEHLQAAGRRLDDLRAAAGRPDGSSAAQAAVLAALVDDLDVPRALDIAVEQGGASARELVAVLAL